MREYETDVLIVGGGGAATAATISAHQQGAKVTLAVKGKFGVAGVRGAGATSNTLADFWTNLTDLLVENGRVFGAIGIDDEGEPFAIRAGAVILATGGVGQLFKYSFNPPGNTGDGYAMALRAGAELWNMEFMQQGIATTWPC